MFVISKDIFQSSGSRSADTLDCQCHCSPSTSQFLLLALPCAWPPAFSSLLQVSNKHSLNISKEMLSPTLNRVRKSQVPIYSSLDLLSPCLTRSPFCASPGPNVAVCEVSGYLQLTGAFFPAVLINHFLCDFCITRSPVLSRLTGSLHLVLWSPFSGKIFWVLMWVGEYGMDNGERKELIESNSLENSPSQIKPKGKTHFG